MTDISPPTLLGLGPLIGEIAKENERIDIPKSMVRECGGELTDNLEAKALPEPQGSLVRCDDAVELHRAKAQAPCFLKGMETHRIVAVALMQCTPDLLRLAPSTTTVCASRIQLWKFEVVR